jgi:P63C domain
MAVDGPSKGGSARAQTLTPERRAEIARSGGVARWQRRLPRADFEGDLQIGDLTLPSAVLEDGRRVLTSKAILTALGRPWKGSYKKNEKPSFLDAKNLAEYLTGDLVEAMEPVEYLSLRGQTVQGYKAELLPLVCEVYVSARDDGNLVGRQGDVADQAAILQRSLSKIGIIGLVDEATGYQKVRARNELQAILRAYIAEELLPWTKRFPDSFYEQIHRVWGWEYKPGNVKRNSYIGKLTNTLIYEKMPPGVKDELVRLNPIDPATKRRRTTHHVHLTDEIGNPHLERQINAVTTLLRATPDGKPKFFKNLFNTVFPSDQGELFPEY